MQEEGYLNVMSGGGYPCVGRGTLVLMCGGGLLLSDVLGLVQVCCVGGMGS